MQRGPRGTPGALANIVIITHETTEAAIRTALDAIEADGKVAERPQMIRIEELEARLFLLRQSGSGDDGVAFVTIRCQRQTDIVCGLG